MKALLGLILLTAAAPPAAPKHYGAPFAGAPVAGLKQILDKPTAWKDKTVTVEGDVVRACSRKGCWMELAPVGEKRGARVTFKDYGFFVPTDSAGTHAKLEGLVELRTVPKDEVDHLEGEGSKFANKLPDGSATEVRIVATGVDLKR